MGPAVGFVLVCYTIALWVMFPILVVGSYLDARDCRVKYDVPVCVVTYVPLVEESAKP